MDKFEELIKKSAESYEAPYSEDAWLALSQKLGPAKGSGLKWTIGGAVVAAAVVAGIWYSIPADDTQNTKTEITSLQTNDVNSNMNTTPNVEHNAFIGEDNNSEPSAQTQTDVLNEKSTDTEVKNTHDYTLSNASNTKDNNDEANDNNDTKKDDLTVKPIKNLVIDPLLAESTIDETNTEDAAHKPVDYKSFDLEVVANKDELCIGETLELRPSIPKIEAKYRWLIGDKVVNGNFVDMTLDEVGSYQVVLELADFRTNKTLYTSQEKTIVVKAKPMNEISYNVDNNTIPTASFEQLNKQAKTVNWNIEGVIKTNASAFSHSFRTKGDYVVHCKVTDFNNCVSEASRTVTIEDDYNLLAPNAFSPEGSGDVNTRTFIPKALLVTDDPFIMTIYDRQGHQIYQTVNAGRPWDGTTAEGALAPVDSYVWIVQLTKKDGEIEEYKGLVTLIK